MYNLKFYKAIVNYTIGVQKMRLLFSQMLLAILPNKKGSSHMYI